MIFRVYLFVKMQNFDSYAAAEIHFEILKLYWIYFKFNLLFQGVKTRKTAIKFQQQASFPTYCANDSQKLF